MTTYSDAVAAFVVSRKAKRLAVRTIEWYEEQLDTFGRWLRDRAHVDAVVTPEIIELYLTDRADLSPATVDGRFRALSAFYRWWCKRAKLDNPVEQIERPKVPKSQPRTAQIAEYVKLLDSIPGNSWIHCRDRLAITTLMLCGVRITGLVSLRQADYDLAGRVLHVRAKGGDEHLIPLLPAVVDEFVQYTWVRPAYSTDELFLASDVNGRPRGVIKPNGYRQRLVQLCKRAGVRYLNPHAFRHGLATFLLNQKGADMALIQRILGHRKIATTSEIYARWEIDGVSQQFGDLMKDAGASQRSSQRRKKP